MLLFDSFHSIYSIKESPSTDSMTRYRCDFDFIIWHTSILIIYLLHGWTGAEQREIDINIFMFYNTHSIYIDIYIYFFWQRQRQALIQHYSMLRSYLFVIGDKMFRFLDFMISLCQSILKNTLSFPIAAILTCMRID